MKGLALDIRAVGVVSPAGVGYDTFVQALRAADMPAVAADGRPYDTVPWPQAPARWLTGFDARPWLGEKGLSALDRSTQFALVACQEALNAAGSDGPARRETGVVLGSMGGGMRSIADYVRSTYTGAPHMVSPLLFPNSVMNCAAGQCAIWHGLQGVNSTVCAGELSGLAALQYAARMVRLGHVRRLLVGSVEEYCDFTAWSHASQTPAGMPLGEGAAVFAVAPAEEAGTSAARALGQLLAARVRAVPPGPGQAVPAAGQLVDALASEIDRALEQAGVDAGALDWWGPAPEGVAGEAAGSAAEPVQREAALRAGISAPAWRSRAQGLCGQSYAASESLRLAEALALAPAGLGLLTAISAPGQVGCALVRTGGVSMPAASAAQVH